MKFISLIISVLLTCQFTQASELDEYNFPSGGKFLHKDETGSYYGILLNAHGGSIGMRWGSGFNYFTVINIRNLDSKGKIVNFTRKTVKQDCGSYDCGTISGYVYPESEVERVNKYLYSAMMRAFPEIPAYRRTGLSIKIYIKGVHRKPGGSSYSGHGGQAERALFSLIFYRDKKSGTLRPGYERKKLGGTPAKHIDESRAFVLKHKKSASIKLVKKRMESRSLHKGHESRKQQSLFNSTQEQINKMKKEFSKIRAKNTTALAGTNCSKEMLGLKKFNADTLKQIRYKAKQGDAKYQYYLAHHYKYCRCADYNLKKSFHWMLKSAEQGYAVAQHLLGWYYRYGEGVKHDLNAAVKWYRTSANQGCPMSQMSLGQAYEKGEIDLPKNIKKALKWYLKAAAQKHAYALTHLGDLHQHGLQGVRYNPKLAHQLYTQAVKYGKGHSRVQAQDRLEQMKGGIVVGKNNPSTGETLVKLIAAIFVYQKIKQDAEESRKALRTPDEVNACLTEAETRMNFCRVSEQYSQFTGGVPNSHVNCDYSPPAFNYPRCKNAVANASPGKYYCDIETGYYDSNKQSVINKICN